MFHPNFPIQKCHAMTTTFSYVANHAFSTKNVVLKQAGTVLALLEIRLRQVDFRTVFVLTKKKKKSPSLECFLDKNFILKAPLKPLNVTEVFFQPLSPRSFILNLDSWIIICLFPSSGAFSTACCNYFLMGLTHPSSP